MDNMLGENKNLRDTKKDVIKDSHSVSSPINNSNQMLTPWKDHFGAYTKTNKLITALYMVTDTMEKDEPIRLKLRTLGIEILSDTASLPRTSSSIVDEKISTILSFLNIASDIRMISEMNSNILRKEFFDLKESIQQFTEQNHLWFKEFVEAGADENIKEETRSPLFSRTPPFKNDRESYKEQGTRIGVQKGGTLLKALSSVKDISHKNLNEDREIIKNKRRTSITTVIKDKPNGVNIKDIAVALKGLGEEIGDKTLQRELIAMVKDNVLKKTGEKRWSQYSLN